MQKEFESRVLADFAKRLDRSDSSDPFYLPFPPDVKRRSSILQRIAKNESFKGAYFHYMSGTWVVKFQLGGSQRVIGRTREAERAIRYADLAILHFWKYRKERPRIDTDFNFPLAMVEQEYADAKEVVRLLKYLEQYFLDCGIISEALAVPTKQGSEVVEECEAVKKRLISHWDKVQIQYAYLKNFLDTNPNARVSIALAGDHLIQLDKVFNHLTKNFQPLINEQHTNEQP